MVAGRYRPALALARLWARRSRCAGAVGVAMGCPFEGVWVWVSGLQQAQPLAPDQLAQEAAGQQGEGAGHQAGVHVQAHHELAVPLDLPQVQGAESPHQGEQGQGHQQVDGGVTGQVGQPEVADEQRRQGGDQHQCDPGVAKGAVQLGVLLRGGAPAGPDGQGPQAQGAERGGEVDGDGGCECHGSQCAQRVTGAPALCDETRFCGAKRPPRPPNTSPGFTWRLHRTYPRAMQAAPGLRKMAPMKRASWIALLVVGLAGAGGYVWWSQPDTTAGTAYKTGKIERGALQATVSASGTVNPVKQVSVGTQVSGQLKDVYADFNTEVKAGQLIAQIDSETFEYRVRSAQADVEAARANVLTAQANAVASQANVSRARTDLIEAQRTHQRNVGLVAQGFIAQSETDKSAALVASAQEALKSAQAQLGVTEAQIKTAEATVTQRQAVLSQAGVDLGRTSIKSPVDGIVIKRAVERGQTVAASLQSPELFVIAQNLSDMQVEASIDEADVGRIRTGQKANFTVDAFPGQTFEGQISQVRKAALNVSNVVTYVAVVRFSNASGRLLPGMTANVRVLTDARDGVLKVPNAALRVRLPGVEPESGKPAPGAICWRTCAPG